MSKRKKTEEPQTTTREKKIDARLETDVKRERS